MNILLILIIEIILLVLLLAYNVYVHYIYNNKITINPNSYNAPYMRNMRISLWILDFLIPIIIAIHILLFKYKDTFSNRLLFFSVIPITVIGFFHLMMNDALLNLDVDNSVKITNQYQMVANYPSTALFIFTTITLILQYMICLYPSSSNISNKQE